MLIRDSIAGGVRGVGRAGEEGIPVVAGTGMKMGLLILALKWVDGSLNFNPAPEAVVQAGDFLIAIGGADQLKKLEALASA